MRNETTPAVEGWTHTTLADDGFEEIFVKVRIAPDLDEEERALAIGESFQIAKALLTDSDITNH
jgi:hypothetical protein